MGESFNRPQVYISRKEDEEALRADFLKSGYKSRSEYLYSLIMKGLRSDENDASAKVVEPFLAKVDQMTDDVKRLESKTDGIDKTLADFSFNIFDLAAELDRLEKQLQNDATSKSIDSIRYEINTMRKEISDIGRSLGTMKGQLDSLKETIDGKDAPKEKDTFFGRLRGR